jgi:threonine dehydrogenase-like Zn-dependent dehydrogenase
MIHSSNYHPYNNNKMSSTNNTNKKIQVVILGCGYAGLNILAQLAKHLNILDVIIVEKREYFTHKAAGLR